ncbi:thiamine pyrophosphate-binding protein [Pleurocapsa sp. FMAR1]|uniref:thiamine pyrophosphate-binding protein n=1 Tax=Pleurocapsa sp. FMAR1 TaxID=3040204 RepID=UPI0029C63240|nr:thiamine pyrophosphate-binding protein [Pleurocapsa sp. FMAR1]
MNTNNSSIEPNIGTYLAQLLEKIGVEHYFTVPGDYNLVLLDQMLKNPNLKMVNCCNELNAGYAADGYARVKGVSAVVVTFTVGGLSLVNAIAGAYAEDLPVIVISGGPNSNDRAQHHLIHHSTGEYDFNQSYRIFKEITTEAVVIRHIEDAHRLLHQALAAAIAKRKPVYIEIACNLANVPIPHSVPLQLQPQTKSSPEALKAAVEAVASRLERSVKPALVAGVKLRSFDAIAAFRKLADSSQYAVAIMPNAKGMFPENHTQYIGCYWGQVSSSGCAEIIESCDAYLFAGPIFNDYTTVGWSCLVKPEKLIEVQPDRVILAGQEYSQVYMQEFIIALADKIKPNDSSLKAFKRIQEESLSTQDLPKEAPLTNRAIREQVQSILTDDSALLVETGDSWFNGQKITLPAGCPYEFQMQYGSIGWATGALLGYAIALGQQKRAIALIGDGSFQLTVQAVSTMIRYGLNPIIFLINNRGYTIEVEIHDGPYNNIKNWDYAGLVQVFNAEEGNGRSYRGSTVGELSSAIAQAQAHQGLALIECVIDRDDCTKELLKWGSRVAAANSRPHQI